MKFTVGVGWSFLDSPGNDGVSDHAYAVGVGDHDWAIEKAGFFEPCGARHFSISVERKPGAEHLIEGILATREDGGDSGAYRAFSDFEFATAGDERGVSHFNALHVGDGIVGAGSAVEWDAQVTGSGLRLGGRENTGGEENGNDRSQERECSKSHHRVADHRVAD